MKNEVMRSVILMSSILLLSQFTSLAQDLPKLLEQLEKVKEDSSKINLLLKIEDKYVENDNDSALFYLQKCKKIIDNLNNDNYNYKYFFELVRISHSKGQFNEALNYCNKTIELANKLNDNLLLAKSYRAIFILYKNTGKYDLSVEYGFKAMELSESIGDTTNLAISYGNLSSLYIELEDYKKAILYGEKGIAAGLKYKDTKGLLISQNNTALSYFNLNNFPKAIELFENQIKIAKTFNRTQSVIRGLNNLCEIYYVIGDKINLIRYANEFNKLVNENDFTLTPKDSCFYYTINSYIDIYNKEFALAEKKLKLGLNIANENGLIIFESDFYRLLTNVAYAKHEFAKGEYYLSKYGEIQDTMRLEKLNNYSTELETKYETEKKETKIKLQQSQLKQKHTLNYLFGGSAAAILLLSFFGYRSYRNKQKVQQLKITELEKEKQLSATEAVLKGEEQERTRLAKDLHDGLGGMLSGIKYSFNNMKENLILTPDTAQAFSRSMDMLDNSIKEMRRVAHNMMPESLLRYGLDKTLQDYTAEINKSGIVAVAYQSMSMETITVDNTTAITIYRIVQELLNNVTKHAGAKQVLVQLLAQGNKLVVNVEDDGKGFDIEILERVDGIGWKNIKSRVDFLKGTLDVQSALGKGTAVNMEFNI